MSDQPKVQVRNADMLDLLRTDFVGRNEPNYAWRAACSAVLALPALRAFWPMSSVDYTVASRARDVAGGGYHLSDNNTVTFGYDQLVPYAEFDGVNQYLSRADGGAANWADILGTEAYVTAAQRGLTMGCWAYFNNAAGSTETIMNKWNGAGQRSYLLRREAGGTLSASVSVDGTAITAQGGATATAATTWYFAAMRLVPSTTLDIFTNGSRVTLAAGVPAAIFDSNQIFAIGRQSNGGNLMDGRVSLAWLSADALSDSIIGALFQNTRKAFNV